MTMAEVALVARGRNAVLDRAARRVHQLRLPWMTEEQIGRLVTIAETAAVQNPATVDQVIFDAIAIMQHRDFAEVGSGPTPSGKQNGHASTSEVEREAAGSHRGQGPGHREPSGPTLSAPSPEATS